MDVLRNSFAAVCAVCLATLASPSSAAAPRDASIQARLASCDSAVARSAAEEMFRDPGTLRHPLMLFQAASGQRMIGRKEEAAFLYLAARLRTMRQILFEKGDRPQLLSIMMMTVGPLVMPTLMADPELAQRVVKRVIDWDRSTPDPFRDREEAKTGDMQKKLAEIDAGLARLPEQIRNYPDRAAKAREGEEQAERLIQSSYAERCGPGTLDPVDVEAASARIKAEAENLVKTSPFVLSQAGGTVKSVSVGSWTQGRSGLPSRLTIGVSPASGKGFYAEVDAVVGITADRKLDSIKTSVACITAFSLGSRDASWRDVCQDDPNARKPKQFGYDPEARSQEPIVQKPVCGFPDLKPPADFAVFVASEYNGRAIGYQIDQSGEEAAQVDIAANSPNKPFVLILSAHGPTIWNISWSDGTKILAVLAGGYHRQAVAGLDKRIPLLISTHDNKGPCGYALAGSDNLGMFNSVSIRAFGRKADRFFRASNGKVVVGEQISVGTKLLTSAETTPESFYDKSAPRAGTAGLEEALRQGLLRKATAADAQAWSDAVAQNAPQRDVSTVPGQGVPKPPKSFLFRTYVVLGPFTYPAGLYGGKSAIFLVPRGTPTPKGNPGHSAVYDFNTLKCKGAMCAAQ